MENSILVSLIDDDKVVHASLLAQLSKDPLIDVVAQAKTGQEGIMQVEQKKPDVILLDFFLPDLWGFEVLRRITRVSPKSKIIFITGYSYLSLVARLFKSAVNGVLLKTHLFLLSDAIRCVYRNGHYIQPNVANDLLHYLLEDKLINLLNDREYSVAMMANKGYSNDRIADNLHLSSKRVSNIKWEILKRLNLKEIKDLAPSLFKKPAHL